jgi:predicted metallopeptidase
MKNKAFAKTVFYFLGYSLIGFIVLILISLLTVKLVGEESNIIAVIEAISTAVAAAAVFGAGYIAYQELSEVANTRYMDIADRLFQELNSQEQIEARRHIFLHLPTEKDAVAKKMQTLSAKDKEAMKKVLNSLDRVAFLTRDGWIPDEIIMPWMHPMIDKSWEKLSPYVVYERTRRNEPYYYEHAEDLANRCRAWREKNLPKDEWQTEWLKTDNVL